MSRNQSTDIINTTIVLNYLKEKFKDDSFSIVTKNTPLDRTIDTDQINRPGMNLFGFFDFFSYRRIQIFGRQECAFIDKEKREKRLLERFIKYFSYKIPICIFCNDYKPPDSIIQLAEKNQIPIVVSNRNTSIVIHEIQEFFFNYMSPKTILHGVMLEVFGVGVLLQGERGIGKSECALELLRRGHIFIGDDVVEISLIKESFLIGRSSQLTSFHMNIYGLGVINIPHLFGIGAVRTEKELDISVVIQKGKNIDRNELNPVSGNVRKKKYFRLFNTRSYYTCRC